MMARVCTRAGALVGELAPPLHAGCWTSSGFHITTGSSSMTGHGALTCGEGGGIGGTSPRGLDCGELVGRGFLDALDRSGKACSCVKDPVCGHDAWDRDGIVAESECVGDALATSVGH